MKIADTAGVLLAGGKSSRFGSNKALAPWQGRPLITHAAELLSSLFAETLLITNTPQDYAFLEWPMTGDLYPGAGPLAGIHAALHQVQSSTIFVLGCDMPLVKEALVRELCQDMAGWDAIVPELSKGLEPLCAVYSKSALPAIDHSLEQGRRKLHSLLGELRTRRVPEQVLRTVDPRLISFENINRLDDLEALTDLFAS